MEKPGNASRSKWMLLAVTAFAGAPGLSQPPGTEDIQERFRRMSREAEQRGLAEPFRGVTTDGKVVRGLFGLHSTGVSTEPVRHGAATFIDALTPEQRKRTLTDEEPSSCRSRARRGEAKEATAAREAEEQRFLEGADPEKAAEP